MNSTLTAASRCLRVDGVNVHYWEAGDAHRPHVVLLHSCEFGASAEFSWEFNIDALASRFHVLAPDFLGYGHTDKIYDFARGPLTPRLHTLQNFLNILRVTDAHFIGNSCGASFLLQWAAEAGAGYRECLPIRKLILVSPSSIGEPGPGRAALVAYDGRIEAMRAILVSLFCDPRWAADEEYLDRRQASALRIGHWESVAAARFHMPGRSPARFTWAAWEKCLAPILFVTGASDKMLALPDGAIQNVRCVKNAEFSTFSDCGHCAQIEQATRFNTLALDYLDC